MNDPYEPCGACGHYPAYCGPNGCVAWDPDAALSVCLCPGRVAFSRPPLVQSNAARYDADEL